MRAPQRCALSPRVHLQELDKVEQSRMVEQCHSVLLFFASKIRFTLSWMISYSLLISWCELRAVGEIGLAVVLIKNLMTDIIARVQAIN